MSPQARAIPPRVCGSIREIVLPFDVSTKDFIRVVIGLAALPLLNGEVNAQQVHYDVDFNSQAPNEPLVVGARPHHVPRVVVGDPRVVGRFGALSEQPLLFSSVGQEVRGIFYYTQIQLSMGHHQPVVDLSFDFYDQGEGHRFIIYFDTPHVRNFIFSQGEVFFQGPTAESPFQTQAIGEYDMERAEHFHIQVDYDLNEWRFANEHGIVANGEYNPTSDQLRAIRMNYHAEGPEITGTAIDNLSLVSVPEPSGLLVVGLLAMGLGRFRCRAG